MSYLRTLLERLRSSLDDTNLPLLIFVNKGIETGTNALTLEIIADTCGKDIAKVSTFLVSQTQAPLPEGHANSPSSLDRRLRQKVRTKSMVRRRPLISLSAVVIRRQPTMVSIAALSEDHAERASLVFHQPWFRWSVCML